MKTESAQQTTPHAIRIDRVLAAAPDVVFRQWTEADAVREWFAPAGYRTVHCEVDARVGGAWRVRFVSASGEVHDEFGEFLEVAPPGRLVFTLTQESARGRGPRTTVAVDLLPHADGTEMRFEQTGYPGVAMRDANAAGWQECLDKLQRRLA